VSLPWKSELSITLGRHGCTARIVSAWTRRVVAETVAQGDPAESIDAALKALVALGHDPLPRAARLAIADEQVYLALRPEQPTWLQAQRDAIAHFAAVLGRQDLVVQVIPLPGAQGWLAAAVEPADVAAWKVALGRFGIELRHLGLTLLADLQQLAPRLEDAAVLVLLRDEGATLIRVAAGVPVEIAWERGEPQRASSLEARLVAFTQALDGRPAVPVTLLCRTTLQLAAWQTLSRTHGWTLLLPRERAVAPEQAAA
jgi:hypothetical protein